MSKTTTIILILLVNAIIIIPTYVMERKREIADNKRIFKDDRRIIKANMECLISLYKVLAIVAVIAITMVLFFGN